MDQQTVDLVETLRDEFTPERLQKTIASLASEGKLTEFLTLIGREDLAENDYNPYVHGKIAVLGESMAKMQRLLGIGKQLGFKKDRFEFCLDYDDMKTYRFERLKRSKFAAVIVGPMPHSTTGTGTYSSVITAMEDSEDYPPVFRVEKITNSSFRNVMLQMQTSNVVVA